MWPRRPQESDDSVALASVRLLRGDAVGLFHESGQGVPAWAYVNVLAHSTTLELASMKAPWLARGRGWGAIVAHLAAELLSAGHWCPEEVDFLQRAALVPLELALLGDELPEPATPAQLGVLVMSVLYRAQMQARIRDNQNDL